MRVVSATNEWGAGFPALTTTAERDRLISELRRDARVERVEPFHYDALD